jgi:hypothetical protein
MLSILGSGMKWQMSDSTHGCKVMHSARVLLEKAIAGSRVRTDVCFHRFPEVHGEEGQDMFVTGHCDVLRATSDVFLAQTFFNRVEPSTLEPMIVHIINEIDVVSLKGFLEWMYNGYGGVNFHNSDGRAMWYLADFYGITSLTSWLYKKGINNYNLCAAFEFAASSMTADTFLITKECLRLTVGGLGWIHDKSLSGFGSRAAKSLIKHQERLRPDEHLAWRRIRDILIFVNRLYIENGTSYLDICQALIQNYEKSFHLIPIKVLRVVLPKCQLWISSATRQSSVLRTSSEHIFEVEYNTFTVCDATNGYNGTIDNYGSGSNLMVAVRNDQKFAVLHVASGTPNWVYTVQPTIPTDTSTLAAISFDKYGNLYTAANSTAFDEPDYSHAEVYVHAPDGTVEHLLDQEKLEQLPTSIQAMVCMSDDCLAIASTTAVLVVRVAQHKCVSQYTLSLHCNVEVHDMAYERLTGHLLVLDRKHNTVYVYNGCDLFKHGRVIVENYGTPSPLVAIASGRSGDILLAHIHGICIVDQYFNVLQNVGYMQDSPIPLRGVSGVSVDVHDRILVQTATGLFIISHSS